jgi:TolA-binding protein
MARRNTALAALGLLSLSLALVACSGTASPGATQGVAGETSVASETESATGTAEATGQSGAEATACDAIQTWSDEMRALGSIDTTTASVEDVQAQIIKIKTAWSDVKKALEDVNVADKQAVEDAGKGLETAVDNPQTDVPIAQMVDSVQTAAEPLRNVYQEMTNGLGCDLQSPY